MINWKILTIPPHHQMNFHCNEDTQLICVKGRAEICGWELIPGAIILLDQYQHSCIVSFQGCNINFRGDNFEYSLLATNKDSNLSNIYINIHSVLERHRGELDRAPRLLIIGAQHTGKADLLRTLVNYRVRKTPGLMMADLDIYNNEIGLPGTIGAVVVTKPFRIDNGWSTTENPLIFNHNSFEEYNIPLFHETIQAMSRLVNERLENQKILGDAGLIMKCDSFRDREEISSTMRIQLIKEIKEYFKITAIFIIDDEELSKNVKEFHSGVIINLPKSVRAEQITVDDLIIKRNYLFYGKGYERIRPIDRRMDAASNLIMKFNTNSSDEVPIASKIKKLVKGLEDQVLTLSQYGSPDLCPPLFVSPDVGIMPIFGFGLILGVDLENQSAVIRTTCSDTFPPMPLRHWVICHYKPALKV